MNGVGGQRAQMDFLLTDLSVKERLTNVNVLSDQFLVEASGKVGGGFMKTGNDIQ